VSEDESQSELIGSASSQDIHPNEAYLYVPLKLIITVDKALKHKVLGPIYEEHSYFFKTTEDRDYLVLLLFLMYEL